MVATPTSALCFLLVQSIAHAFTIHTGEIRRVVDFRSTGEIPSRRLVHNERIQPDDSDEEAVDWQAISAELVSEDEDDGLNDGDWLPDRVKALARKERARIYAEKVTDTTKTQEANDTASTTTSTSSSASRTTTSTSAYTDEEEEMIAAMGGKVSGRRREAGFIGDSTLSEIATDYSVPISYLADVLCMWGVAIPINVHESLGNLVTGEQAFAIVEAVHTLDVSALHDRYSNTNVQQLCYEWDIDLQAAFAMIMQEGWSLPFGVQTCLRVEQERELLRALGGQGGKLDVTDYDDDNED